VIAFPHGADTGGRLVVRCPWCDEIFTAPRSREPEPVFACSRDHTRTYTVHRPTGFLPCQYLALSLVLDLLVYAVNVCGMQAPGHGRGCRDGDDLRRHAESLLGAQLVADYLEGRT